MEHSCVPPSVLAQGGGYDVCTRINTDHPPYCTDRKGACEVFKSLNYRIISVWLYYFKNTRIIPTLVIKIYPL